MICVFGVLVAHYLLSVSVRVRGYGTIGVQCACIWHNFCVFSGAVLLTAVVVTNVGSGTVALWVTTA